MKKIRYILTALLLLSGITLFAQGYFSFGYGPSIPMGDSKDYIDRTSWRFDDPASHHHATARCSARGCGDARAGETTA